MKNSADLGGWYPPRPSALVDNTLLDLQNSSYPTQPHSIIAKYFLDNVLVADLPKVLRIFEYLPSQSCCTTEDRPPHRELHALLFANSVWAGAHE